MNKKQIFLEEKDHRKLKLTAVEQGILLNKAMKNAVHVYCHLIKIDPIYVSNILNGSK